ncbi:MAG: transcriptional repressor LexA [Bacteroidales bacterium]
MSLGKKLKELRKEKDYSLRELAKKIGDISASYLSDLENERYDPSLKKLNKIADALNVSTAYLLDIYDQDKTENQEKFYLKESKIKYTAESELIKIPIIGEIAAGEPILAEERIIGYKKMPLEDVECGTYFLLKVNGDSMINAGIYEGDCVLIRKQPDCETGEIAAVIVDNENATLKRVYFNDGNILLQPENPNYKPMNISAKEIKIIGKAIEVIHKLN